MSKSTKIPYSSYFLCVYVSSKMPSLVPRTYFLAQVCVFLSALDQTIITTAVPVIAGEFDSPTAYTWIGSSYLLASAAFVPPPPPLCCLVLTRAGYADSCPLGANSGIYPLSFLSPGAD